MQSSAVRKTIIGFAALFLFHCSFATVYYVSVNGNDASGNGSSVSPWRTLQYAVSQVPAGQGHTIQLRAGIFIENGLVEVPPGVSIVGAGKDSTTIRAVSSFYYHPADPGFALDKFLIRLNSLTQGSGTQSLRNFTIDGDSKQLHGGIYIRRRDNIIIDGVRVQNTNFNGIWLWDSKDSKIMNSQLMNCSWGSTSYSAGGLHLGNLERVEIANLNIDESTGYGIKAIGPDGVNNLTNLVIHDSDVSVHPVGLWSNGLAPNIAIELWNVNLKACEIYNTYVDNTISLVNNLSLPSTGVQTIRVHDNILDIETRANGEGYGIELTLHDAEIDHNYFIKGTYGIANWAQPMQNWNIHHNIFYAIQGTFPGDALRSQSGGLHNVKFYNNVVEFASDKTMNVIGVYGGVSDRVEVINNLFINNNTAYNYYPNSLLRMEGTAVMNNLIVKNNFFDSLDIGSVPGATYANNLTGDPQITETGNRPDPYYQPNAGSPLIDAGIPTGFSYEGSAPDIGGYEYPSTPLATANAEVTEFAITDDENYDRSEQHENQVAVYPNPARGNFTVQYTSPVSQRAEVTIKNSAGAVVKKATGLANEASGNIVFDTSDMISGTYYVKFRSGDGPTSVIRIVIPR
jgi:hypothetical protein